MSNKRQRSGFPESTFKNLIDSAINGTKFADKNALKAKWSEEFNVVEGAEFLKHQEALHFDNGALISLRKSLKRYSKHLDKLSVSPTADTVAAIYKDLNIQLPADKPVDEQISQLIQALTAKKSHTSIERDQMEKLRLDYENIEKEYLKVRKVVFKTWRTDYSQFVKYLKDSTNAEIKSRYAVREAELGHRLNATEKREFKSDVAEAIWMTVHDKMVSQAEIFKFFTEISKREGFTPGIAERYSRLFQSRRDIDKIKVDQYRVSRAGLVCARLSESFVADIVRTVVSTYSASIGNDPARCGSRISKADLANSRFDKSILPFLESSRTYTAIRDGHGLELHPRNSILIYNIKKILKNLYPAAKTDKELFEIIASIICEMAVSFINMAIKVNNAKVKTIGAECLKTVLRVRYESLPETYTQYAAIVESSYAKRVKEPVA